ncbi:MAG: hypothetical protein ACFE8E_02440 [Candidatus Hodarchaeota archaeon]
MNWEIEKESFYDFIIRNNVIGFYKKPVKLKSGRLSPFYINWRKISEDVYLIDILTDYILLFIEYLKLTPDCFFGVPEGATKLGIIIQFKWAKKNPAFGPEKFPLPMGRGKVKDHGELKDRIYLGMPKGKVVVLEDVTTTGDSLVQCISRLQDNNINVIAAVSLTNRNEIRDDGKTVEEVIKEKGVDYFSMSVFTKLIPKLALTKELSISVESYFKKYGVNNL